jgi:hypothetical protein
VHVASNLWTGAGPASGGPKHVASAEGDAVGAVQEIASSACRSWQALDLACQQLSCRNAQNATFLCTFCTPQNAPLELAVCSCRLLQAKKTGLRRNARERGCKLHCLRCLALALASSAPRRWQVHRQQIWTPSNAHCSHDSATVLWSWQRLSMQSGR